MISLKEYLEKQVQSSVDTLIKYGIPADQIQTATNVIQSVIAVKSDWFREKTGELYVEPQVKLVFHVYYRMPENYGLLLAAELNWIDSKLRKAIQIASQTIEDEWKHQINYEDGWKSANP